MVQERILVVDDDEGLLRLLTMRLSAMGFDVTTCTTCEEALAVAKREVFDLALTDLRLPDRDGLTVLEELRLIHPNLPVLLLTAHGSIPSAVEAMQKGAFGYLTKPFDDKELMATLEKALAQQRMSREIQRLKLLVKELYGHVKGAFTSAQSAKRGLIQTAEGGTLFLDEIGEMPLNLQVKLLRAIQEREVQAVGAERPTKVNVRIITSTNKDLSAAVRAGTFREDLFYRIQVFPITIPPLRERRDDIPLLAQHFLQQSALRMHKEIRGFLPAAMQRLMLYSWPGHVRELENAIEKAVVLSNQDIITPDLLPTSTESTEGQLKPLTEAKEEFERNYLKEVLQLTSGNISRASQTAGRYRADFYKLLKKHGLHPGDVKEEKDTDSAESA